MRTVKHKRGSKHKSRARKNSAFRYEIDSFGIVAIPKDRYWGPDTQRSLIYFSIGKEKMPIKFIHTYALFKKCAAVTNYKLGLIDKKKSDIIIKICNEIINNKYNDEFPCHIWQTGSGSQTNMNVNEVIANICNQILIGKLGTKFPISPIDDVNMSQSTNDSFISVMHIFIAITVVHKLIPNLTFMINGFKKKQDEFNNIIKIGRTHLEDAVPLTFGQEFSGYVATFEDSLSQIKNSLKNIYQLAAGGTAVGTGIDTVHSFGKEIAKEIAKETRLPFVSALNKYAVISNHNAVLEMSDALKLLATNIMKIANDLRWLGSGPNAGIHELTLPQNEAGSSIMPGKVNPTQCEAAAMVAVQVMANNMAITIANSQGYFELNVYNPLMLYNITQSMDNLSDVCNNFTKFCVLGIQVNKDKVQYYLDNALTLATALNKHIGYDKSTVLARYANKKNISLKQANKILKFVPEDKIDEYLNPKNMIHN